MTLFDLVKKNNWADIESRFIMLYPDYKDDMSNYCTVFNKLKELDPSDSDSFLVISKYHIKEDNSEYYHVTGCEIDPELADAQDLGKILLFFMPWSYWLGIKISCSLVAQYTSDEIICHCLKEMTSEGFNPEEIESGFNDLVKAYTDYKRSEKEIKKLKKIAFN